MMASSPSFFAPPPGHYYPISPLTLNHPQTPLARLQSIYSKKSGEDELSRRPSFTSPPLSSSKSYFSPKGPGEQEIPLNLSFRQKYERAMFMLFRESLSSGRRTMTYLKVACCGLAMITVLLCYTLGMLSGHSFALYSVPYLSYVGAEYPEKLFFISGFSLTALAFLPILFVNQSGLRYLRINPGLMVPLANLGKIFGLLMAISLPLFSSFDVIKFPVLHYSFITAFYVSAFLWETTEVLCLYLWYRRDKTKEGLKTSLIAKFFFLVLFFVQLVFYLGFTLSGRCDPLLSLDHYSQCSNRHLIPALTQYFMLLTIVIYISTLRFAKYDSSLFVVKGPPTGLGLARQRSVRLSAIVDDIPKRPPPRGPRPASIDLSSSPLPPAPPGPEENASNVGIGGSGSGGLRAPSPTERVRWSSQDRPSPRGRQETPVESAPPLQQMSEVHRNHRRSLDSARFKELGADGMPELVLRSTPPGVNIGTPPAASAPPADFQPTRDFRGNRPSPLMVASGHTSEDPSSEPESNTNSSTRSSKRGGPRPMSYHPPGSARSTASNYSSDAETFEETIIRPLINKQRGTGAPPRSNFEHPPPDQSRKRSSISSPPFNGSPGLSFAPSAPSAPFFSNQPARRSLYSDQPGGSAPVDPAVFNLKPF